MSEKTTHFAIRALAPDNDLVINQLIELFNTCYGDLHPNRNVYSSQYWRSHIISRIVSLAVFCDGKIVAHLALMRDGNDPSVVQLVFPALHPQHKHSESMIISLLRDNILQQAARKSWKSAFYFDYLGSPASGTFDSPILGESDIAIAPGYFPRLEMASQSEAFTRPPSVAQKRYAIQVRQAILGETLKTERTLFVPERHLKMVKYLYEPFNLKRNFRVESDRAVTLAPALPADSPAYFDQVFPPIEVRHIFAQPSLISDTHRMSLFTSDPDVQATYIFVDLCDPLTPKFCAELESKDFKFCGIMPCFFARENIVFYSCDGAVIETELVVGQRAKALAAHMEQDKPGSRSLRPPPKKRQIYANAGRV